MGASPIEARSNRKQPVMANRNLDRRKEAVTLRARLSAIGGRAVAPFRLLRRFRNRIDELLLAQRDTLALVALSALGGGFVPLTQYSMRPCAVLTLVNEIVLNHRRCIVECGAGASTIYMARALRSLDQGGRVMCLEHDAAWLSTVASGLHGEGLDKFVSLVHAPLKAGDWGMGQCVWYDSQLVEAAAKSMAIDMLLVDGPSANAVSRRHIRYAAVPVLQPFFSDRITVILDDIDRIGEQELLSRWEEILSVKFDRRPLAGRIAVARIGSGVTT